MAKIHGMADTIPKNADGRKMEMIYVKEEGT